LHLTTLYWTLCTTFFTVRFTMSLRILLTHSIALLAAWAMAAGAIAGTASAVSADDAQVALAQGAYVLDVRSPAAYAAGHLPQASLLPHDAAKRDLHELAGLLTQAGVDSSRTMLIVSDAGDAHAQALWQRLAQVTSGRVLWLVGGVQEWQMRGHGLTTDVTAKPPVPQVLVPLTPFEANEQDPRMAGSKVRSSSLLERNLRIRIAAVL
jgi:3-mercaptopyruvate sulfurtransferase SseA